jgi:hypothetical protein
MRDGGDAYRTSKETIARGSGRPVNASGALALLSRESRLCAIRVPIQRVIGDNLELPANDN